MGDGTGMGCWALKALQGSAGRKEVWKGFHSCSTGKDECTKAVGYLGERGDHEARSSVQFSRSVGMWVKKQQLEPDMEQQTVSKLRKEYVKAVYSHPAYLTYMQSTSCEMLGWMNNKLDSRLPG